MMRVLLVTALLSLPWVFSVATTHGWVVRVGALFNVYDEQGYPDFDQVQALSAFVLGIHEVNANLSVIGENMQLEWVVPDGSTERGYGFHGAVHQAEFLSSGTTWPDLTSATPTSFIGQYASSPKYVATEQSAGIIADEEILGVDVVVGGMPNLETITHDMMFGERKLIQLHTSANDTRFGSGETFPYKIQTNTIESFQGMVLQHILCSPMFSQNRNTSRIVIFFSPNDYGTKALIETQDETYCEIEVLAEIPVRDAPQDYSSLLEQLIETDVSPSIFVFHTNALTASQIIAQGTALGLFGSEQQLWGPAGVTVPLLVNNNQTGAAEDHEHEEHDVSEHEIPEYVTNEQIAQSMKGYLGIRYAPSYGLRGRALGGTEKGTRFVSSFKTIDPAAVSTSKVHCDVKDSLGSYVFRSGGSSTGACVFDTAIIQVTALSVQKTITFTNLQGTLRDGMFISWMTGTGSSAESSGTSTRISCDSSQVCTVPSGVTFSTLPVIVTGAFHISAALAGSVSGNALTISKRFSGSVKNGTILLGGSSSMQLTAGTTVSSCSSSTICTLSTSATSPSGQIYIVGVFSFMMFTESDGRGIYPYAPHAYDAIYSIGHAVRLLEESNRFTSNLATTTWDSDLLSSILMINVTHEGATGKIKYYEGMANFGGYAQGGREQGHTFTLWNFNYDGYLAGQSNDSVFNYVGTWQITTDLSGEYLSGGVSWCKDGAHNAYYADRGGYYSCATAQFNSRDGKIPSIVSPYHFDTPETSVIKIGGIFSNVDEDSGAVDSNQAQGLAAFLMACEDVNAAFGSKFKFRHAVVSGIGRKAAVEAAGYLVKDAFSGTGVDFVVSAGENVETMAALKMFEAYRTVQIHALAQDTLLGSGTDYPFKIQTVPIDSFQGMVLQSIMCQVYGYGKTSVWASSNEMGAKAAMESGDGTYCPIDKISSHTVKFDLGISEDGSGEYDLTAWDSEIDTALKGGARVFVIFLPAETTAGLLVRGFQRGLFKENTQIFTSAQGLTSVLAEKVLHITKSKDLTKQILKGAIAINFAPAFHWRYPAAFLGPNQPELGAHYSQAKQGRQFIDAFKLRQSTIGVLEAGSSGGIVTCNQDLDDSAKRFLWREQRQRNFSDPQIVCSGVDFSKFSHPNGADIWPYTAYVYDAVWSFAYAIDRLMSESMQCVEGPRCFDADEVRFFD